ncbi:MAG: hypothetical protein P1U68_14665 [Verrucomicrobiales bacterium]|nr:hypothetical protein [Verrucomicrobiales bacterium]
MIQVSKTLLALLALAALFQSGCTGGSSGPVAITKVNPYHLQPGPYTRSEDEMIVHEHRRYLHGAVDSDEIRERYGNYFTIFWNSANRTPATVKFEYCQASTGPQVYSKEIRVSKPKRKNVTKLDITGEEYKRLGKVTQWRASVLENGVEVAEYRSFLWR